MADPIFMRQVSSTAIKAIGYDNETKTLFIEFRNKENYPTYQFSPVGAHTAGRMLVTRSVGSYYHRIIKPRRQYQTTPDSRQVAEIMNSRNRGTGSLIDVALTAAEEAAKAGLRTATRGVLGD